MAFLQILVSQQLLFLFSIHLDTMSNVMDCAPGKTDLWCKSYELSNQKIYHFHNLGLSTYAIIHIWIDVQ